MSTDTITTKNLTFVKAETLIKFSENRTLGAYACESAEPKWNNVGLLNSIMRQETKRVCNQQGGYDKTGFTFRVTLSDGTTDEYEGRIDIGSDTKDYFDVVEDHIIDWMEYLLNQPEGSYYAVTNEDEKKEILQWIEWAKASKKQTQDDYRKYSKSSVK